MLRPNFFIWLRAHNAQNTSEAVLHWRTSVVIHAMVPLKEIEKISEKFLIFDILNLKITAKIILKDFDWNIVLLYYGLISYVKLIYWN